MYQPPVLKLKDFCETGALPELAAIGSGEFLVTAVAGTILMAGFGGDEVVTIVIGQYRISEGPREGQYDTKAVMIRHNLGEPLHTVKFVTDLFANVEDWVNRRLEMWYALRPLRDPRAFDANPLKHF